MQESSAVRDGLSDFYRRFGTHDDREFAGALANGPGVSVIGTAPGEGHDNRDDWIEAYRNFIAEMRLTLRADDPKGWAEGRLGWAVDTPSFVLPDGSTLPTRLTAVLREEDGAWKIVHLHFSVGVPDEEAIKPPPGAEEG
jgi:hypothetical protein